MSIGIGDDIVIGRRMGVRLTGGGAAAFVGAYDAIPSITAAYGMRRLLTSYTGNILRLRRASDNAESDFGYDSNGDLDAAAIATWLTATTGYVVTWYDQSGNGYNATQATAASQPLYVSQAGGLDFDGSNDHLATGIIPASGYSWQCKFTDIGNAGPLIGTNDSKTWNRFGGVPNSVNGDAFAGNQAGRFARHTNGVIGIAGQQAYQNGAAAGAAIGAWTEVATSQIWIGRMSPGVMAVQYIDGRIQELVISSATYDATQMATINTIMVS